jgi:hypothetical protein
VDGRVDLSNQSLSLARSLYHGMALTGGFSLVNDSGV